jgi:hypothetical protein
MSEDERSALRLFLMDSSSNGVRAQKNSLLRSEWGGVGSWGGYLSLLRGALGKPPRRRIEEPQFWCVGDASLAAALRDCESFFVVGHTSIVKRVMSC